MEVNTREEDQQKSAQADIARRADSLGESKRWQLLRNGSYRMLPQALPFLGRICLHWDAASPACEWHIHISRVLRAG